MTFHPVVPVKVLAALRISESVVVSVFAILPDPLMTLLIQAMCEETRVL